MSPSDTEDVLNMMSYVFQHWVLPVVQGSKQDRPAI